MKLSCTNFAFQVHSGNTSWKAPRGLPGSGLLPGKGTIAIVMVTWWPSSTAFQNPLGMCASDIFWLHAMSESKHFHQGSAFETWSCILLHKCSPIVFLLFFLWFWEVALCLLDTIIHNIYKYHIYIYIILYNIHVPLIIMYPPAKLHCPTPPGSTSVSSSDFSNNARCCARQLAQASSWHQDGWWNLGGQRQPIKKKN